MVSLYKCLICTWVGMKDGTYVWTIEFVGNERNIPQLRLGSSSLTGAGADVARHRGGTGGGDAGLGQNGEVARGAEVDDRLITSSKSPRRLKSNGTGAEEVECEEQRAEGEHVGCG